MPLGIHLRRRSTAADQRPPPLRRWSEEDWDALRAGLEFCAVRGGERDKAVIQSDLDALGSFEAAREDPRRGQMRFARAESNVRPTPSPGNLRATQVADYYWLNGPFYGNSWSTSSPSHGQRSRRTSRTSRRISPPAPRASAARTTRCEGTTSSASRNGFGHSRRRRSQRHGRSRSVGSTRWFCW